jgi:hypothetical protein
VSITDHLAPHFLLLIYIIFLSLRSAVLSIP